MSGEPAAGGLGHPPPATDLAFPGVYDASPGKERYDARCPDLGSLLDYEVHPSTFGHRLIEGDLGSSTIGSRELLLDRSFSSTTQRGSEQSSPAVHDLDSIAVPAAQDLENVVGLIRWQFQVPTWLQC